jgi:hypothetical protein
MLVLLDVEGLVAVPAETHADLKTSEAILDGALVRAGSHRGIAERHKFVMVRGKDLPGIVSTLLEVDNHEAAHEEGSVGLLGVV